MPGQALADRKSAREYSKDPMFALIEMMQWQQVENENGHQDKLHQQLLGMIASLNERNDTCRMGETERRCLDDECQLQ